MSKKVLIFDDNEVLVDMMTVVMLNEGYKAMGMPFTHDFMQIVQDYKPDVLLMDYSITSRFNAYELCYQAKTDPETSHIPVIMFSIYNRRDESVINGHGFDEFIKKPFSLDELICQVKKMLFLEKQTV